MPDRIFTEPKLAALYDAWCAGRPDFYFYLPLVMQAASVLDVGCGTGELLRLARAAGHTGRLVGVDPAEAMLNVARARADIEWRLGEVTEQAFANDFDLAVMTGHAFQVLLTDEEILDTLSAVGNGLTDDGRFVFETRNPLVREWERWPRVTHLHLDGVDYEVTGPAPVYDGRFLKFESLTTCEVWSQPEHSSSTLRCLNRDKLSALVADAGLTIEAQYGDWDRSPFTDESLEIITVARRP